MRIVFAGRENAFDRGMVNWLSRYFNVVSVFFLEPGRLGFMGRWRTIRNRWKRNGLVQTVDELAFHAVDRLFIRRREPLHWRKQVDPGFLHTRPIAVPSHTVANPHDDRWLERLKELQPDIVFAVCGSVIFKPAFFDIPKLGTFVLHEGITPEYRGLHNPLWALVKGDHQFIGFSLIKIDRSIDGGSILCQKRYELEPGDGVCRWSLVGHKAILRNLDTICEALARLGEKRTFEPVSQAGRHSAYYSWMRLSTFFWLLLAKRDQRKVSRDRTEIEGH